MAYRVQFSRRSLLALAASPGIAMAITPADPFAFYLAWATLFAAWLCGMSLVQLRTPVRIAWIVACSLAVALILPGGYPTGWNLILAVCLCGMALSCPEVVADAQANRIAKKN